LKHNDILINLAREFSNGAISSIESLRAILCQISKDVIFYGAGRNMYNILELYKGCGLDFYNIIWDVNANTILHICGNPVVIPDFTTVVSGKRVIITISNHLIAKSIRMKLEYLGYTCVCGFHELFSTQKISNPVYPIEFSEEEKKLLHFVEYNGLTMVSREQMFATMISCKYAVINNIPGDFVECGVWRGGNAILAAGIFKIYGSDKNVWLFDTFNGFLDNNNQSEEFLTKNDISSDTMLYTQNLYYDNRFCGNSLDDVKTNFNRYCLLSDNIHFIRGDILQTLDSNEIPSVVSVLKLDTDLYSSTLMELKVLYPLLTTGGVLIIDDYGLYNGLRTAVDEYFTDKRKPMFHYIDYQSRLGVKVD